jgi:ATP/maltotriose-dependent transcriptional regulator MalT
LAEHLERGAESAAEHLLAAAAWARAGQRASDRCAQADAIRHYDRALSLLGASGLQAAPTDVATRPGRSLPTASIELAAQLGGGSSRAVIRGSEVSAVEDDFQRALELAHATGDGTPLFRTLIGLYSFAALRSRFATARELGERCMRIAKSTGDAALEFEACRPLYSVAIFVGEMAEARRHIERAKALLDRVANRPQPVMLSMYTEVALWFFEALSCALGGDVDRAIEVMQRATAFAEQRRHAFSDAFAAYGEALLARTRGEPRLSLEAAERCFAAADEFDFNWLRHLALGYRGWAEARLGKPASGIARLRAAVDGLTASGETMTMTDLQCALAECCIADGRFDEARLVVEAIAKLAAESGGVVFEPERLRLRAVLELSQHGAAAEPEAVDLLQRAIVVAERQEAPFLALRAARVLAQVLARTDRLREARELLDRAIGGVRTSASVADIREAVKERAALGS